MMIVFKTRWVFTACSVSFNSFVCLFTGTMLTKERHLRTWISFFYVLTRLLMEGMHIYVLATNCLSHKSLIYVFFNSSFVLEG